MIVIKIHRCQIGQDFMTLYSRIFKCLVIAAWYILLCYNIWLLEVGRRTAARPGEVDAGPHILGAFLDRSLSELVILCNHFVGKWHTTSIWNSLKGNFFLFCFEFFKFCNFLERFKLLVLPRVIFPHAPALLQQQLVRGSK